VTVASHEEDGQSTEYNVLVTSAGRRIELIEMLRLSCAQWHIMAADVDPTAPALYFADEAVYLPPVRSPDYEQALLTLCSTRKILLIIPTIDTELPVLAELAPSLRSQTGTRVAVGSKVGVDKALDKLTCAETLTKAGLPAVPTVPWEDGPCPYALPVIVKPRFGSAGVGVRKIASPSSWTAPDEDNWIVQPFVSGPEVTVDAIVDNASQRVVSLGARRRLKVRGGEVERAVTLLAAEFVSLATQIADAFELDGPFNFQVFIGDNHSTKVISEINPRFGGGCPLSEHAGARFAKALFSWSLEGVWPSSESLASPGILMSRFDQSIFRRVTDLAW
jgi:carbamoyl-phosphate synthase large subunit